MVAVGVNVANFGHRGNPRVVREMIIRAEGSDVDLVMVSDHVAVTPDVHASYPAPFLEAFSLLAWASGFTERLTRGLGGGHRSSIS